jgi:hypothetical protein
MFKPYSSSGFLTGGYEDIQRLKRRHPRVALSVIARTIEIHGPRRAAVEAELARMHGHSRDTTSEA